VADGVGEVKDDDVAKRLSPQALGRKPAEVFRAEGKKRSESRNERGLAKARRSQEEKFLAACGKLAPERRRIGEKGAALAQRTEIVGKAGPGSLVIDR